MTNSLSPAKRRVLNYVSLTLIVGVFFVVPVIGLAAEETVAASGDGGVTEERADDPPPILESAESLSALAGEEESVKLIESELSDTQDPVAEETEEIEESATETAEIIEGYNKVVDLDIPSQSEDQAPTETAIISDDSSSFVQINGKHINSRQTDNLSAPESAVSEEVSSTTGETSNPASESAISSEISIIIEPGAIPAELAVSDELVFTTIGMTSEGALAVSKEFSFSAEPIITSELAMSDEVALTTEASEPIGEIAVSDEIVLTTISDGGPGGPTRELAVSGEFDFNTLPITPGPSGELAVSGEFSFATSSGGGPGPITEIAVSDEFSFATSSGGGPGPTGELTISDEFSFNTLAGELAISDELDFTTESGGGGGGGGGGGSSGGGGSGGSGSFVGPRKLLCEPYLKEFIRFGADNNPVEVLKLKIFLNTFEDFNLPLTPVYDLETFRAVEIFQQRYADDILDPWNIADPTGFVYITTSLKINYIFCGITESIDLSLIAREDLIQIVPAAGEVLAPSDESFGPGEIFIPAPGGEVGLDGGFDLNLGAALPFLRSIGDWLLACSCIPNYLLFLLILMVVLFLYSIYRRDRRGGGDSSDPAGAAGVGGIYPPPRLTDGSVEKKKKEVLAGSEPNARSPIIIPMPGKIFETESADRQKSEKSATGIGPEDKAADILAQNRTIEKKTDQDKPKDRLADQALAKPKMAKKKTPELTEEKNDGPKLRIEDLDPGDPDDDIFFEF